MARWTQTDEWVSQVEAAQLIGCHVSTVEHYIATGAIEHREHCGERPGVNRSSAEAFALQWRERVEQRQRWAAARALKLRRDQPPTDDDVWVTAETLAIMLSRSRTWVTFLAASGRIPATRGGARRWWFRRTDAESYVAAQVFMRRQAEAVKATAERDRMAA